ALMAQTGVLATLLPEAADLARFAGLVEIETGELLEADPLLRLAALLPGDGAAAAALAERLRLSNAERDRLRSALDPEPVLKSWMSPKEVRRVVHRLGPAAFRDRAKLAWAAAPGTAAGPQWRALIALAAGWTAPAF